MSSSGEPAVAVGVDSALIIAELARRGLRWVVTVPDTHQRTLLARIAAAPDFRLTTAATEDEAIGICAGLWWGGVEPLLLVQHAGLFASVNTLRGIGIDMGIPITALAGLYARDPAVSPAESRGSMNRLVIPLLDTLDIPFELMESSWGLGSIGRMQTLARERARPAIVLVGAETT